MSNYIKYYRPKNTKSNKATHEANFIDARGRFPRFLKRSKDYYYVIFGKIGGDQKEMTTEEFQEFIKDYEEMIDENGFSVSEYEDKN